MCLNDIFTVFVHGFLLLRLTVFYVFVFLEGIIEVIVYSAPDDPNRRKNRGFCFVQYDTHKNASNAKKRLSSGRDRPWNTDLVVDWAEQQEEPDEEVMQKVIALFILFLC